MPKDAEDEGFEWGKVLGGRALLLIHGTFSTADAAFSEFVDKAKAELNALYGGRVFAFNHPTLHVSPGENLSWFLAQVPRASAWRSTSYPTVAGVWSHENSPPRLPRGLPTALRTFVRKVVWVGTPNRGTVLADGKHGMDIVDRYTNLITELPDGPFTLVMEGVLALVKILYNGSAEGLPGLHCMQPGNRDLAAPLPGKTRYYGIASDFRPAVRGLLSRVTSAVAGAVLDDVFTEPSDAVSRRAAFTIRSRYRWIPPEARSPPGHRARAAVHHCNYFSDVDVRSKIIEWAARALAQVEGTPQSCASRRCLGNRRSSHHERARLAGPGGPFRSGRT